MMFQQFQYVALLSVLFACAVEAWAEGPKARSKEQKSAVVLDSFPMASELLLGKLPVKVTPKREYRIKAGMSGILKLDVDPIGGEFEAGARLGGIDTERLALDQQLLEIQESLLRVRDVPEKEFQRKSKVQQLEGSLAALESEVSLSKAILRDPKKYQDLFPIDGEDGLKSLHAELEKMVSEMADLKALLVSTRSLEFGQLERDNLVKSFELKKLQFELQKQHSYLTVPFSCEVQFIYPYDPEEDNYVGSGAEIAILRDKSEIHAHVPIFDSRWRALLKPRLSLRLRVRSKSMRAVFFRSSIQSESGTERLIYSFRFREEDHKHLTNHIGGSVEGDIFYRLEHPAYIIPKFKLLSQAPEAFKRGGWSGIVESLFPGHEFVKEGLNEVAVQAPHDPKE